MVRHLLAPVLPRAARALDLPRKLDRPAVGPQPPPPAVALTFDDGPHPQGTPAILEILSRWDAKAMFFLIGEQVERRPSLAAEIAAQGHAIAVHGYRHHLQLRLSPSQARRDVVHARAVIAQATGVEPRFHRPPYGIYSPAGLRTVRDIGLQPLLWSSWGKDWRKFTTPARIAARVTGGLVPGDVILLHDADFYSAKGSHRRTAAALEIILAKLAAREIGTVLPI
jgi:peptidoglycan-N-acetylglucosamine deacetylase